MLTALPLLPLWDVAMAGHGLRSLLPLCREAPGAAPGEVEKWNHLSRLVMTNIAIEDVYYNVGIAMP